MESQSASYQGARFYKCDLHMHTPADAKRWRDEGTRITNDTSEPRKVEVARLFLRRCHEVGLEVIAVTDHNFARAPKDSFVNYLRRENENVARELNRHPLTIFPGFEIEADVGTGHHVLCLFPDDAELQLVHDRLTACDLPQDARFDEDGLPRPSTMNLRDILTVVQKARQHPGLVICPHPFGEKGMLNDENCELWLQQEEFTNPDLLCVEVPKPVKEFSNANLRNLIIGGEDCLPEWRRGKGEAERPIAYVCSSDCYRLEPTEKEPHNYIGYRYTWIKMSKPSIEALRQAFLDRDSRIRLCKDRPENGYEYPRITCVRVNGAKFYRADPIYLSPNLNCIIGSRGSGKSTLIDYIRLALDRLREGDLPSRLRDEIMGRINGTLVDGSTIVVDFESSGIPFRVEYEHGCRGGKWTVSRLDTCETNPEWSIRTLFPVRILSQREIDESVEQADQRALARILDELIAPELEGLMQKEAELRTEIESLDLSIQAKREGQHRRRTLVTNRTDLEGRLARLDAVKQPLERWTTLERHDRYLKALLESCERSIGLLKTQTKDVFDSMSAVRLRAPQYVTSERGTMGPEHSHTDITQSPDHQVAINEAKHLLDKANATFDKAVADLKETVDKGIATFEEATSGASGLLRRVIQQEWGPLFSAERQGYEEIKKRLEERGDKPEEYLTVKSQLDAVLSSISQLDSELGEIDAMEEQRVEKLSELRNVWRCQTDARIRKARELMERLRPTPGSKPLVEIDVIHQGDINSMVAIWSSKLRDRRRINEQDISNLIQAISEQAGGGDQLASLSEQAINSVRAQEMRPMLQAVLGNRLQAFLDTYTEKVLREIERDRVEDRVAYRVYRQDGSLAGPIDRVSVGQKGLAFLNLLLASGDVPLLVDTPEEGLDNEGVYAELVPVFRREKEKRQIIIATHNANLPVNADAELIVALEAVGVVDVGKLPNDSVRAIEQSGAALTCTHEKEGPVRSVRPTPKQPSVAALADLAARMSWHKDAHEYLTESCGWSDEEASMLVDRIAEYREVYGKVRRRRTKKGGKLEECLGALDKPVVKQAVQDIMEGSEHAFRKRWEKYGF